MMRLGAARGDNLIPHFLGKGNIDEMITVNVAQLAPAQAIFRAAKTLRMRGHARPA